MEKSHGIGAAAWNRLAGTGHADPRKERTGRALPARPGRRPIATVVALLSLLALTFLAGQAPAAEPPEPPTYLSSFGPDGPEATDFNFDITSIAVDQQTGDVYVLGVDPDVFRGSILYKFDEEGHPVDFTGTEPYIEGNEIKGIVAANAVAVDSTSHVVYVTEEETNGVSSLRAFQADGEAAEFTAGPGAGTSEIAGFGELLGLAVDANGAIYASDRGAGSVYVYASTGELLVQSEAFGEDSRQLAVASDGMVYANLGLGTGTIKTFKFTPSSFPVTAGTTYTKSPDPVTGDIQARDVSVDPLTDDVYVVGGHDDDEWVTQYDKSGALIRYYGKEGEPGDLANEVSSIAVNGGTKKFYVGNTEVVRSGEHAGDRVFSKVEIFGPPVYLPLPPTVKSTSVLNVTADSAKLRALINPNTLETTYHFEYGPEDCSFTSCTEVAPASIGSGHKDVFVFAQLAGLQPGTPYHYRVVAENEEGTSEGPDRTFTTQLSTLGFELADSRVWEMVSPPEKHGAVLILPQQTVVSQAAADGEGLAYASFGSIEAEPEGNRVIEPSQVLARRGADGWRSEDISPPHTEGTGISTGEFRAFNADLSRALVNPRDDTPLSSQASEHTAYLRDNTDPATYTPLLSGREGFANVPPGTEFGDSLIFFGGADPRYEHIAFTSSVPLIAGAPDGTLYLWSEGGISPISEKPASEGGEVVQALLGSGPGSTLHALSDDGSRAFWAPPDYNGVGVSSPALYLRDTEAGESVRLDVVQPGASGEGQSRPAFQGASADGTVVFFTDTQQLTEDASPEGRDLYRCEIPAGESAGGCAILTDISAPLEGSGESARFRTPGITQGLSEDGSRIYFTAGGVLDTQPNKEGESAGAGEPNLYLWEEGQGRRFIATLDEDEDMPSWGRRGESSGNAYTSDLSAAGSPEGRYLTFMSQRSLTGYDNRDAASGKLDQEIFRYDAQSEELECISCNPSGASPVGGQLPVAENGASSKIDRQGLWQQRWIAATVPEVGGIAGVSAGRENILSRPRAVLDNGRVFFNALDSLVPADSNGQWDVYQYEPLGVGDCSASSAGSAVSRSGSGCVSLISSGNAEEEAAFIDAGETGNDVFFLSTTKLAVTDEDTVYDVYDARVDGVPAKLTPRTECLGEACQSAPLPPNDPTPASASFRGAGNAPSTRCPKGKKRQTRNNGTSRCVAMKKHKKKSAHRHKRAADKRRTDR